jgi:putative ABC transport system permease protein
MNGIKGRLRSYLRGLLGPGGVEAEMDEEMRFHVEMEAERLVRERGLEVAEARRRAAIAFGGVAKYKEQGREARGLAWLGGLSLDLRLGLRMLAKYPGITLVGALGMAAGIAISAAAFSVIGTLTRATVPLDEGDRVVAIDNFDAASGTDRNETHLHDLAVWREELTAVRELAAFRTLPRNVTGQDGRAEPLEVAEMTASGFRIARVAPMLGRYLLDEDERPGAPAVIVIGYDFWQQRYGGRPDVLGMTLRLGSDPHTIVGVMPETFAFPVNNSLWTPLRLDPAKFEVGKAPPINVFGRLAPGATLEQARGQLTAIGRRLAADGAETREQIRPTAESYGLSFVDDPQLMWAYYLARLLVGLVLGVIAVNVAILSYARAATRAGEITVRLALGATRSRVAAQLFAEALVLSGLAALIGLVVARFIIRRFNAFLELTADGLVPYWWKVGITPSTVAYTVGLALFAAGIVAVLPALRLTGRRTQAAIREVSGTTGLRMGRGWTALIALQAAAAVSLIPVAAGVPLRAVVESRIAAPAVPLESIFTAEVTLDGDAPPASGAEGYEQVLRARFTDRRMELVRRLEAEPGVSGVALASSPPGAIEFRSIEIDAGGPNGRVDAIAHSLEVEPKLFELFGATLQAGRGFDSTDLAPGTTGVIVNESFVQAHLGGGNVLGQRFRYRAPGAATDSSREAPDTWYEIIGVVSDFPDTGLGPNDAASVYHPSAAPGSNPGTIVVRLQGTAPEAFVPRLREITSAIDPTLRVVHASTIAEYVRQAHNAERLVMLVMAMLPWTVLLLSAAGVHALVSLTVSERRKELGLRIALGARPGHVVRSIAGRALRQIALGIGVGGVAAAVLIPLLTQTNARAAALLAAVVGIMLLVSLVAVVGPARHGLKIAPMQALKGE